MPVDGGAGVDSKVVSVQAAPSGAQVLASTETNTGVDGLAATGISAWLHTVGTAMALVGAFGLLGLRKLSRTTS